MHKLISNKSIYTHQIKIAIIAVLSTIIPLSLVLITVYLTTDLNLAHLTMDQAAVAGTPPYIGFFSNIGILFWCACAAICLFSFVILKIVKQSPQYSNFFLYSGLLNTLFLVDDFFLLHEYVLPKYLYIDERILYAIYMILVCSFFIKFRRIFKQTEFLILVVGTIFLGLSIISDAIWHSIPTVVEDTLKLTGITTWVTYFVRLCLREISVIANVSTLQKEVTSWMK
ncbi:hypothetical protein CLI64_07860 [Nostoc sp. CENA543]|uniref:hypothetical protein n=1 Tax=Nostoc sp. CENA543 TaxID=1869241 RepID=UPI000CA1615F|nr:hypothetical protein [Nostoc sp. CENA543]AUT00305.1 hypothetical protein CLI64_07860 [Nostoc sp. CENA543]